MKKKLFNFNYFLTIYPKYFCGLQNARIEILDLNSTNANYLNEFLLMAKTDKIVNLAQLMDIVAVDKIDEIKNRFQLCYNFINNNGYNRVIIRIAIRAQVFVPSIVKLFSSANWLERECWDLMGIPFLNHPDLRRILTNYGFEGHPLRKDFPAVGYVQVRYDDEQKSIIEEPVSLSQEYRYFDFLSPWQQLDNQNFK